MNYLFAMSSSDGAELRLVKAAAEKLNKFYPYITPSGTIQPYQSNMLLRLNFFITLYIVFICNGGSHL
jgi:hypothetical protein